MEISEQSFDCAQWTEIIRTLPGLSLMQSWEYAEAKAATGPWSTVRAVITNGEHLVAALQGSLRSLPFIGGGLLWINRGPLIAGTSQSYEDLLEVIARWAASRRWYVRIAPPVADLNSALLTKAGFHSTSSPGWSSSNVDLSAPELRSQLDGKWRNVLNKSLRAGVTVEQRSDDGSLIAYANDLFERLRTKPFPTTVTPEFLTALQSLLPAERKLIVFSATRNGIPLGANVIAVYGDTAEYISGLINDEGRQLGAGHALLWAAIEAMHVRGLRRFDLGGLDPDRTPKGIIHFKQGVNGIPYRLANEVETTRKDWRSRLIRWQIDRRRNEGTPPVP